MKRDTTLTISLEELGLAVTHKVTLIVQRESEVADDRKCCLVRTWHLVTVDELLRTGPPRTAFQFPLRG